MCKRSLDVNIGQLLLCKLFLRTIERRTHKRYFSATLHLLPNVPKEDFPASEECEPTSTNTSPHTQSAPEGFLHYCNLHPCKIHPREFYFYMSSISREKTNCSCSGFHFGGRVSLVKLVLLHLLFIAVCTPVLTTTTLTLLPGVCAFRNLWFISTCEKHRTRQTKDSAHTSPLAIILPWTVASGYHHLNKAVIFACGHLEIITNQVYLCCNSIHSHHLALNESTSLRAQQTYWASPVTGKETTGDERDLVSTPGESGSNSTVSAMVGRMRGWEGGWGWPWRYHCVFALHLLDVKAPWVSLRNAFPGRRGGCCMNFSGNRDQCLLYLNAVFVFFPKSIGEKLFVLETVKHAAPGG